MGRKTLKFKKRRKTVSMEPTVATSSPAPIAPTSTDLPSSPSSEHKSFNELVPEPEPTTEKEVSSEKEVEENLRNQIKKHWSEAVHPMMIGSSELVVASGGNEDPEANYISEYIERRVDSMAKKGFKPVYTGTEIIEAIKSRDEILFQEMIIDITHKTVLSVLGNIKKKTEARAFSFDDFVFITLARIDYGIARESFSSSFRERSDVSIRFPDGEFDKEVEHALVSSDDKGGLESFTEMFFHSFKNPEDVRENINIPIPEHLLKLVVD